MPPARTHLNTFATDLAFLLPGLWSHEYHGRVAHEDQYLIAEQLWDVGHVSWVVNEFALSRCSVLNTLEGQRLLVIDRPRHPHQFVVAPLVPDEDRLKAHHFDGVDEPNGITVSNDPRRAADQVERRLLPRYERALKAVRRNAAEEPEPPHRPAPPHVAQVVTLTWYADGALGTPYASVPKEARMTLYAHGFPTRARRRSCFPKRTARTAALCGSSRWPAASPSRASA
ncbi:hypothetical protein GA0115233_106257 [Streptomyces sp. DI166]|uniref:hypothetical protein n=1 Tax=Streptomyces sp. DI166 TaxID=1839783 RepID=UPI0007F383D8|nr:hypothetical protein [Streptomyces sp. DI166]SBT93379.1 hypothetical protein GA0115233_106257 [Streptomyces sp. DI166]